VEIHGLVGHVLRGEVALPSLDLVTSTGDELLFEAFFLHSVLAAAAYKEGVMVEGLLDRFLSLRQAALRVIAGEISWKTYADGDFAEKGQTLLTNTVEQSAGQSDLGLFSDWDRLDGDQGLRQKGQDAAALERLFRLVGLADIGFVDIQMKILDMPVSFIYHKKGLKSTGLQKFEEDLQRAMEVHKEVIGFDEKFRRDLLDKLTPSRDVLRIYGLEYVARHLEPKSCLKLLILALRGLDRFCSENGKPGVVDFHELSQIIDRRYQAVSEELATFSMDCLFTDGRLLTRLSRAQVGIMLNYNDKERVVKPLFQDRLQVHRVIERIRGQENILRLKNLYHRELKRLRNHIYHTEDYQRLLSETFHDKLQQVIDHTLKDAEKRMRQQRNFSGIERIFYELMELAEENDLSEEQVQLAKDMYEFNRDRIRNRRLEIIYREIDACTETEDLMELWNKTRSELQKNRRHFGKEFEDLVTARFDRQLEGLIKL
jgi:hypothetical protein